MRPQWQPASVDEGAGAREEVARPVPAAAVSTRRCVHRPVAVMLTVSLVCSEAAWGQTPLQRPDAAVRGAWLMGIEVDPAARTAIDTGRHSLFHDSGRARVVSDAALSPDELGGRVPFPLEPPELLASPAAPLPPLVAQHDGSPAGTGAGRTSTGTPGASLGEAPQDIAQIFLRQSSSLLPAENWQFELGFNYLWQEAPALVLLPGDLLDFQQVRDRRVIVPLTLRYGWNDRLEVFGTLPVGVSHFERLDAANGATTTRGGLGDVSAGFLYQWLRETDRQPDVITSVSFTAPTGPDPFGLSPNVAALGTGFWSVGGAVNVVQSFDPIVLFGGVGYRHEFGRSVRGVFLQPGETFTYSCGVGFSVNDDIALTAELSGAYQTRLRANGRTVPNSATEPVALQVGYTRRLGPAWSIQPYARIGLTPDAPDFLLGCSLISSPRPGGLLPGSLPGGGP